MPCSRQTTPQYGSRPGKYEVDEDRSCKQKYDLAVFNLGESEPTVQYECKDLGLAEARYKIRDLWEQKDGKTAKSLVVGLQSHASVLYELTRKD